MTDKEQELLKCIEEERNFIWDAVRTWLETGKYYDKI